MYVERDICQMHYFRYMRNGYYNLKRREEYAEYERGGCRYRIQSPNGYQKVHEPDHPLITGSQLYVFEHRVVYYDEINQNPEKCELCGDAINWSNLHIDHKDEDRTNNKKENLRALCRSCNVYRGHTCESIGTNFFEINGRRMTAFAWARQPSVVVCGATIARRRNSLNMSDYDCVYSPRVTHHKTKTHKQVCKYDNARGITAPFMT